MGYYDDGVPTIERGSYGDRGVLENRRPDGLGSPSNDQQKPDLPDMQPVIIPQATVVVDSGSKLSGHSVEISNALAQTAHYGGHGSLYPTATGSPVPSATPDKDWKSGVDQQTKPNHGKD